MNASLSWGQKTDVSVICPKCRRKGVAAIDWDRDMNLGMRITWTFPCSCGFHVIDQEFGLGERLLLSLPYAVLPAVFLVFFSMRAGEALNWRGTLSFAAMLAMGILFFVVGYHIGKWLAAIRIQTDLNRNKDVI